MLNASMIAFILAVAALVTSMISAILGMAGGMMLLAIMFCFMSHGESIPTHAAVQIASNGTRALSFLGNVDRSAFGRFLLGMIPGSLIGMILLWLLGAPEQSEPYLKTLVGVYILFATWLPGKEASGKSSGTWWDWPLMGLTAGTAALTVGAVGPLIAPLFARRGFVKERLIATKAVCQLSTHAMKIPAFILLRDLDFGRLGGIALLMILMVIPGTLIGKRILKGIAEHHFKIAFRATLTAAGLKVLIFDGLYTLISAS